MGNFTFENQGANTYLVYGVDADEHIDTLSLGMITNNKIPGILPVVFTQMDENRYFKYNISSKISVKQFFSGVVNRKRLLGVLASICAGILAAEEYMIETSSLVLNLEYVFADVSSSQAFMVCLPTFQDNQSIQDLGMFFKGIVFQTQFDQTENCNYVASIISYLNSTPMFSMVDFKKIIDELLYGPMQNTQNSSQGLSQISHSPAIKVANNSPTQMNAGGISTPIASAPIAPAQVSQIKVTPTPVTPPMPPIVQGPSNGIGLTGKGKQKPNQAEKKKQMSKNAPTPAMINGAPQKSSGFAVPGVEIADQTIQKEKKSLFSLFTKKNKPQETPNMQALPFTPSPVKAQQFGTQPSTASQVSHQNQTTQQYQTTQPYQATQPYQTTQPQPATQQYQATQQYAVKNTDINIGLQQAQQASQLSFGETSVLGGTITGETTVLNGASTQAIKPILLRIKNGERIALDKPVFRIGKEKSYVDYFISDNTAVSRSHANIIIKDNKFYIVDTNSTNHTYLNGIMLQSNIETQIEHGSKIRIANEEFEFKLY